MHSKQGVILGAGLWTLVAAFGCSDDGSGGAGGASSVSSTSGSSSTSDSSSASDSSSTTSSSSASSGGGEMKPTFAIAIVPVTVDLPYGGQTSIDVRVNRFYGFDEAVEVVVSAPPPGLATMPITVSADASIGTLEVGASGALSVGTEFILKLLGTSGNQVSIAGIPATVVAGP